MTKTSFNLLVPKFRERVSVTAAKIDAKKIIREEAKKQAVEIAKKSRVGLLWLLLPCLSSVWGVSGGCRVVVGNC